MDEQLPPYPRNETIPLERCSFCGAEGWKGIEHNGQRTCLCMNCTGEFFYRRLQIPNVPWEVARKSLRSVN